jgi:zinc finger protein
MKCFEQGETKFLMTEIPFYKEIIISSFRCERCGHNDVQVTNAASLEPKAIRFTLTVDPIMCEMEDIMADMGRTVVRTDSTVITIPEIGFTIPANRSEINTVEGLLMNIRESLAYEQPQRKLQDPELHDKMQEIIDKFQAMQDGEEKFSLSLYDPAGHCFVSNPFAPSADPRVVITYTERTREEYIALGYPPDQVEPILTEAERVIKDNKDALLNKAIASIRKREARHMRQHGSKVKKLGDSDRVDGDGYKTGGSKGLKLIASSSLRKKDLADFNTLSEQTLNSTVVFPQTCSACRGQGETRMCLVDIPYFGEIVVMCTSCDRCGFKDTEIKSSQAYSEKAVRISVKCDDIEDLSRDVLKSGDSGIEIPELGLVLPSGVLGSRFSSIEGILSLIQDHVGGQAKNYTGDSESGGEETKLRVLRFVKELEEVIDGTRPFTFVLDDPAGNSFIEGRVDGKHDTSPFEDKKVTVEYYTRTKEQDDLLGISDMVTENYYHPNATTSDDDDEDDDEDDDDSEDGTDSDDTDEDVGPTYGPQRP